MGKWTREQRPSSGHQPRVPHLSPVRGPSAVLGEPASPGPLPPAARAKLPSLPPPPGLRAAFSAPWLLGSPRLRSLWAPRSTRPPSGFRLYSASCKLAIWVGCRECPWPRGSGRFIRRWWTQRGFSFWGVTIKNTAIKTLSSRDTFLLGRSSCKELRGQGTQLPNVDKHC